MKNNISKMMMIAAAAATLFVATEMKAAPGGGGSGTTAPTPVTEQEKSARSAVEFFYSCPPNSSGCTTSFSFDPAYRLVIESITGYVTDGSSAPMWIWFHRFLNGQGSLGGLAPFMEDKSVPANAFYMHSFRIVGNIYADSLGNMAFSRPNTGGANFVLSGYLVKK